MYTHYVVHAAVSLAVRRLFYTSVVLNLDEERKHDDTRTLMDGMI